MKPSAPLKFCRGSQDARACPSKGLEEKCKTLHFNESRVAGGNQMAFQEPQPRKVVCQMKVMI